MATLKDVAALANVDISTVSRAINNVSYVHPETKDRIKKAMETLGYKPNYVKQALKQGPKKIIGIIVPRMQLSIFGDIVQRIELETYLKGYTTLICRTDDDPKVEKDFLKKFGNGMVDGIIISSTGHNNYLLRKLYQEGLSIVQIVRRQESSISSIVSNYEEGCYKTVKYLYDKGCRNIGLINGPVIRYPYRARLKGYKKAVKELNIKEICVSSDNISKGFDYGLECTKKLLAENPDLDAIMGANDMHGMAALQELKRQKISVPGKVKVVSLTGNSVGALLETKMTALELPSEEIGKLASQMIINEIENKNSKKRKIEKVVLNSTFISRSSG